MDGDKVERLRERLLQCPVCMDEFHDPRLLPCHHTMCSDCIQRLLLSSSSGRMFRCPQCRRDVCVPRGGITELPVNFFVRSLQDELGDEVDVGPCQICRRSTVASQFRCIDCDLDICRFCIHEHRLVLHKDSSVVNILRMEVGGPLGPVPSMANKTCTIHTEEVVQLFCETCQHPVCVSCSCGEHRKHVVLPLGKKLHCSREHLQKKLESLTKERRGVKAWMRQLEGAEVEARDNTTRTLGAVQFRTKELHGLVDKMSAAVMEKVRQEEQQQLTKLATCRKQLTKLAQRLDLGVGFLRGLQEGDVCLELIDAFKTFSSELDEIRDTVKSNASVQVCDQKFLAGRHLQLRGYLAATFGSLRARYSFLHFGNGSPPLLWKLSKKLTVYRVFVVMMLLAMLYTVGVLSSACYHSPDSDNIAALIITVYLTISACFAFSKA
ncbi:putative E3 ubiquitin-protein ligase MID2 [Babylonia areolata]|uniref:putative E3 ubiquitin-protein ligase MID2 n=1 Tax=Babylonia areolata TaxID=304850 RepID=UPI003FD15C15